MRRAELLAALAGLALAGCMKIYPDPELPDIEAEWTDADCRSGTGDVTLALVGTDDTMFRRELAVPCTELKATLADVPRERFHLEGVLRATSGEAFGMYAQDLDLRDGLDARAYLYFGGFSNLRVGWAFDMGASCASLGADFVLVELSSTSSPEPITFGAPCETSPYFSLVPDGIYTIVARAVDGETTVAISAPSPELAVTFDGFTDAGTLVLSPCGAACP